MQDFTGWIVSVNVSPKGGVPRVPLPEGDRLTAEGLAHDHRAFEKHRKTARALSVLSIELLDQFQHEGFTVAPGIMAENVTVYGVDLCKLETGTRLTFENGVEIEVTSQRKPCYQLNPMGAGLEQAAVGRSGVMCSVVKEGELKPGLKFKVVSAVLNK